MIDAHVHLGSLPQGGKNWGDFEEYKKIAEKLKIEKYCVKPIGKPEHFKDKKTPENETVLLELEENNSVIPVYWFNVFDLPESIDERYKAIKFHSDIGQVAIDDKRIVHFVNKIQLPIYFHTNESKDYSNLEKVANLAKKVKVPVIALHSGSVTRTFFNLDNYKFPDNVYFETSGIQYALILKKIYQRFGAERIVFGSDYPFGDPRVSLAMIETLDLDKNEYDMITEKNIKRILNL